MRASRTAVWLTALVVALFQVMGSLGAADRQPDRRSIDALAIVLLLIGPAALALRDRWPLVAVAVAVAAADVYVAFGFPYGPIFLSPIVAMFFAIQAGQRRGTWALAAAGYGGLIVAYYLDPRSDQSNVVLHFALVAGWLVAVLVVSELVRAHREQRA
ncbi:MAG: sensor histidine kinase, partial [Actinobacteria bacterium]